MLFETATLWLETAGRIATLWLNGATIAEIDGALDRVARHPFVEILVIRGAHASGFAVRDLPGADRWDAAIAGRQVLDRLENLPVVTLAYLEGPCVGRGLELALACDRRLAVATPDSWIAFGDAPRWGGTARWHELSGEPPREPLTPREAQAIGLIDQAFSERRAKIELRSWLDRLEDRPVKRRRSWWARRRAMHHNDREWRRFQDEHTPGSPEDLTGRTSNSKTGTLPDTIELRACPQAVPFAVEFVLRGGSVVTDDPELMGERLREPYLRGRVTPLEYERARARVGGEGRAKLVLQGQHGDPLAIVSAALMPYTRPIRIGFSPLSDNRYVELTQGPATDAVADLFAAARFVPLIVPDAPQLSVRPALAAFWDEAVQLVAEGLPIDLIDDASRTLTAYPPLRTLDTLGMADAVSILPRLRPFADAGLHEAFYHADRPREANALAQAMLGAGPRLLANDDDRDEATEESLRSEITARLRGRIVAVAPETARAGGFKACEGGVKRPTGDGARRMAA